MIQYLVLCSELLSCLIFVRRPALAFSNWYKFEKNLKYFDTIKVTSTGWLIAINKCNVITAIRQNGYKHKISVVEQIHLSMMTGSLLGYYLNQLVFEILNI